MRTVGAAVVAGIVAWGVTPAAAAPPRIRALPWPPAVLPQTPPLAPPTSGVLPLSPLFLGRLDNRERIVVGMDDAGKPHSIRVLQRIVIKRLGDYVFAVPAPVRSVTPGPGAESVPGQRENQILWEGFSPGRRVLAALADLRVRESVGALPVEVRVEPGEVRTTVTVRNMTGADVTSFTANPEPLSLAKALDQLRRAISRNVSAEGLNVGVYGKTTPAQLRIAAPMQVTGTAQVEGAPNGVVRFSGLLDGLRRTELRVVLRGRPSKVEVRVTPAPVADRLAPRGTRTWVTALRRHQLGDGRRLLARAITAELTYARKRQYDTFLASPEQSGPNSGTYVYRTTAPARATAAPEGGAGTDHTVGWIALAVVLAAALPAGAVIWAHS
jgi:hypothetical protein